LLCHNAYCFPSQSQTIFQIGADRQRSLVWFSCFHMSFAKRKRKKSYNVDKQK